MHNIHSATDSFEDWLTGQFTKSGSPDPGALELKHEKMRKTLFDFFRATFYRWAQLWSMHGEPAEKIAAVGDVHAENFGAWGKPGGKEGWGVNDFDEAAALPWTSDLTRLGVSAVIGLEVFPALGVKPGDALEEIIKGYAAGLDAHDALKLPKVLEVLRKKVKPEKFWEKQEKKLEAAQDMPSSAVAALAKVLGTDAKSVTHWQRKPDERKGTGSLGKRRYFALGKVNGEPVMAEAKAYTPSAVEWLAPGKAGPGLEEMLKALGNAAEPDYGRDGAWVTRRLTPEMVKTELGDLEELLEDGKIEVGDVENLFSAMGKALARIHALNSNADKIRNELGSRQADEKWYRHLVDTWRARTTQDFAQYTGQDVG